MNYTLDIAITGLNLIENQILYILKLKNNIKLCACEENIQITKLLYNRYKKCFPLKTL